jgi:predicted transcriptional regulator of viral defense system
MKETTYYDKINKIFKTRGHSISRTEIDHANIPSWFFYDFVKRNNLTKLAPGFYTSPLYQEDDWFLLQQRYPKFVFSGMCALYLLQLTDKIPDVMTVTAPRGYHPSRKKIGNLSIRYETNSEIYSFGIIEKETLFGNKVRVYSLEKTICDLIKNRDAYDSETFIKALRIYAKRPDKDDVALYQYARRIKIELQVFELMEVILNEN